MNNGTVIYKQKGFTLVELLIVVIILAILAAIVVPQFASTTDDARDASLDTNLANLRSAMGLYYQQHGDYPGHVVSTGDATCAGTVTMAGTADSEQALIEQLSYYTNAAGQACSSKFSSGSTVGFEYGPYLDAIPENPLNQDATVIIVTTGDLNMSPQGGGGWRFDTVNGKLIADNN